MAKHRHHREAQATGTAARDHETMNNVGDDEMGGAVVYGVVEDDVKQDDLDL